MASIAAGTLRDVPLIAARPMTIVSDPKCPACRGLPMPEVRKRDVLGGFPWKRDKDGKKVPR